MNLITLTVLLITMVYYVIAASPSNTLYNRLQAKNVTVNTIGCKCIMSKPTPENTDTTLCMCFNRDDGTANETSMCRAYTGKFNS